MDINGELFWEFEYFFGEDFSIGNHYKIVYLI
jgi:hypothetical protein